LQKITSLKLFFAIILFLSFAIRPIYHVGYVAYFQLNIDYIIDTYCVNKEKPELQCNGNCHLTKQLSTVSNNDIEPKGLTTLAEAFYPVFFQIESYETDVISLNIKKPSKWHYLSIYIYRYSFNCFHPPKYNTSTLV